MEAVSIGVSGKSNGAYVRIVQLCKAVANEATSASIIDRFHRNLDFRWP